MKIAKKLIVVSVLATIAFSSFAAKGGLKAGTYTGKAQGRNGPVTVSVTVTAKAIKKVVVDSHTETPGISDAAFDKIPAAIAKKNTLNVDTVTGATVTSNAIIEAVADAVSQAGGNPADWK